MKKTLVQMTVMSSVGLLLVGCGTWGSKDVNPGARTMPPMVTLPGQGVKQEGYYMVPNVANSSAPVSMAPPNTDIKDYQKTSQNNANGNNNPNTPPTALVSGNGRLPADANLAWKAVGQALGKTRYKVLDQDSAMQSYYVLDSQSTNNAVTEKTPIYRVYVRSAKGGSEIVVMNQENQPADAAAAQRITAAIQQQMPRS